jgi:hypothetical protein
VIAYLSIDLDFWRYHTTERSAIRFFDRVFALKLPIFVAPFHDQLLSHIDESGCNVLINVDAHSDLGNMPLPGVDMPLRHLTEGSWGNFISWKATGKFIWRYPDQRRVFDGYCHDQPWGNPEDDTRNPLLHPELAGWRQTSMRHGLSGLPWKSIRAVGVCLSAYWLGGAPIHRITDRLRISQWRRLPERLQRRTLRPFLWAAA